VMLWSRRRTPNPTLSAGVATADFPIPIAPYGILGTRLTIENGMVESAPPPVDGATAFVDPAGLHHVQGSGPGGAGGAAGVIYRFLGIAGDAAFPAPVVAALYETGRAKYHSYPLPGAAVAAGQIVPAGAVAHCIHAIGPDFRRGSPGPTWEEAVEQLAGAYEQVLLQFDGCGVQTLRLLPISGGIFAGPYMAQMPRLTRESLSAAMDRLPSEVRERLLAGGRIKLCIFLESEWEGFLKEGFRPENAD